MTSLLARPQVGIERLPAARRSSTELRESMNCKSCRKRKIKCNRLRPTCEACNIFQCACIYDAVPKKRGPKTDVLEALLMRVDGLEKRLRDEKKPVPLVDETSSSQSASIVSLPAEIRPHPSINTTIQNASITSSESSQTDRLDILIDTYFLRVQDKPFHILDEQNVRQQHLLNQLPPFLRLAIYARSVRFTNHSSGRLTAVQLSEEYAIQARNQVDVDEPSIEGLQTLLLLHSAFYAIGRGQKSYMLLSNAIGMAIALNLHREAPAMSKLTSNERELRRQLFWTCYIMDRFASCGSKRPSLLADKSLLLRLPSWNLNANALPVEGEYFSTQTNLQYALGPGRSSQGSVGMLIDITRILGITNRYLAAGGVKGDSHFPWHALSNLSKIRQDLDIWAQGNEDLFVDVEVFVAQSDYCVLVLSKLVYHLIHCLIYRLFLPIDLTELQGTGQHHSWQIEATRLCFMHANAIADLAELGRQTPNMEWPAFIGYCLCTAGTIHVHGAHYSGQEGEVYSLSAQFLSREFQHLSELRFTWASIQHQVDTLHTIYVLHAELVKSLASSPMRFSPVFHLEDFFDRYPGQLFNGAYMILSDMVVEPVPESMADHGRNVLGIHATQFMSNMPSVHSQMLSPEELSFKSQTQRRTDASLPSSPTSGGHRPEEFQSNPFHSAKSQISDISESKSPLKDQLLPTYPFSPSFVFSPLPQGSFDPVMGMPNNFNSANSDYRFDPTQTMQPILTPGGRSQSDSTHAVDTEKDPFLTLLEQLAENEHSQGGPSDLDYYLDTPES